jgi:hypothetical protein
MGSPMVTANVLDALAIRYYPKEFRNNPKAVKDRIRNTIKRTAKRRASAAPVRD